MADMSMEEFLGHSTRDSGKGAYLENWKKKRSPPQIDTFLHPGSRIVATWQHPWPKMVELKDDKTGATRIEVWGGTFNSWEKEAVNRKQYQRDPKVTGPRVIEPTVCPMSLMIEAIHEAIREGRLDWCEEVFKFIGTDPTKGKILHAGGLYNGFGHRSVTEKQKAEIAAAGILLTQSWQENMMAKCNYIFTIVDADNPGLGAQVTTEKTSLGDKVKTAIKDEMTSAVCAADPKGMQGNPMVNPYCIRWVHNPKAEDFGDYYKALIMRKIEVDDEIQAAFDEDPPDVSFMAKKGNIKKLRDSMESAYVGPADILDFDEIFAPSEAEYARDNKGVSADEAEEVIAQAKAVKASRVHEVREPDPEPAPEAAEEAKPAKRKRRTKKEMATAKREDEILAKLDTLTEEEVLTYLDGENTDGLTVKLQEVLESLQAEAEPVEAPAEEPAEGEEMFGCDKCEHPMKASEDTCGKCGTKYNLETGEIIEEAKPTKPRSRSAAKPSGESGDRITF